jgi:hypothetical protein
VKALALLQRKVSGGNGFASLTRLLRKRLRGEGVEDVEIEADGVNVPGGPLAVLFTLTFRDSVSDQRKISLENIALDECVRYIQTPHDPKVSGPNPHAKSARTATDWNA